MPFTITALSISTAFTAGGAQRNVAIDRRPNECPICHALSQPDHLQGVAPSMAYDWLEIYFRCGSDECRRHYTTLYRRTPDRAGTTPSFVLERSLPTHPKPSDFDEDIKKLSPTFIKIYDQAVSAEAHELDEIAGPGYRKALEFLVKDYAIWQNPDSEAEIKAMQLAAVISKFLNGNKLPVVSSRAAWLGNDETHYERRWVEKDLEDLKQLIKATAHFMAYERLAMQLPSDMPDSKNARELPMQEKLDSLSTA